jgi:hypothetical protein
MRGDVPRKVDAPQVPQLRRAKVAPDNPPATLEEAVGRFGQLARSKLSAPTVTGQPEDQLRTPVELLTRDLGGSAITLGATL